MYGKKIVIILIKFVKIKEHLILLRDITIL